MFDANQAKKNVEDWKKAEQERYMKEEFPNILNDIERASKNGNSSIYLKIKPFCVNKLKNLGFKASFCSGDREGKSLYNISW